MHSMRLVVQRLAWTAAADMEHDASRMRVLSQEHGYMQASGYSSGGHGLGLDAWAVSSLLRGQDGHWDGH